MSFDSQIPEMEDKTHGVQCSLSRIITSTY